MHCASIFLTAIDGERNVKLDSGKYDQPILFEFFPSVPGEFSRVIRDVVICNRDDSPISAVGNPLRVNKVIPPFQKQLIEFCDRASGQHLFFVCGKIRWHCGKFRQ